MSSITSVAPQFLVDDLKNTLAFYERKLGFKIDFVYEDFYASVSRDGAVIHMKCAPKLDEERTLRRENEHLDAFFSVTDAAALHKELTERSASMMGPLTSQPWGTLDFKVTDPDGYILCFSQDAVPTD